ncbi:hypothetical protein V8C42DRAFT_285546 [Trichoderma barbatum]
MQLVRKSLPWPRHDTTRQKARGADKRVCVSLLSGRHKMDLPEEGSKRRRGDQIPFCHITRGQQRYVQYAYALGTSRYTYAEEHWRAEHPHQEPCSQPRPQFGVIPLPQYISPKDPETRLLQPSWFLFLQSMEPPQASRHVTEAWRQMKGRTQGGGCAQSSHAHKSTFSASLALSFCARWFLLAHSRSPIHSLTPSAHRHTHAHT